MVNNNFNLGWSSQSCVSQPWGVGENQLAVREVCRIHSDPTVVLGVGFTRFGNTFVLFLLFWGLGLCSPWRAWAAQGKHQCWFYPQCSVLGEGYGKGCGERALRSKACHTSSHCRGVEMTRWFCYSVPSGCLWPGDDTDLSQNFSCLSQVHDNLSAFAPKREQFLQNFVLCSVELVI